ncbi:hypothetical protein L2750_14490 [Shewanella submarina]|uniref:DUF3168 domain-containing protein n=1 Tax=Shewanella submarina TaxID=2016376 RepID=A0ABV7G555_9GAMM|nr:hypothetical protein [Shewanella submarina]MCL1038339.1 hypothetical protein [Shewanella submarina]
MTTKCEQILEQFKLLISAEVGEAVEVVRNAMRPGVTGRPVISITMGEATPKSSSVNFYDWSVIVNCEVALMGNLKSLDNDFLNIRNQIQKALMTDIQIGLPFVIQCRADSVTAPAIVDGDYPCAVVTVSWVVDYRAQATEV